MSINKEIIKQAQSYLKDMGYEVKTNHVYQLLAKLSGHKNWNVAKAKSTNFLDTVRAIGDKLNNNQTTSSDYLNQFLIGWEINDNPQLRKPILREIKHSLFAGASQTFKSLTVVNMLQTWLHHTGAGGHITLTDLLSRNYQQYKSLPATQLTYLPRTDGLMAAIELFYQEVIMRRELLAHHKCATVKEYEKLTNQAVPHKILVLEDFHLTGADLNLNNYTTFESESYKLRQLMQTGDILKLTVIIISQKITKTDIPETFIQLCTNRIAFKMSKAESAYLLGNITAGDLGDTAEDQGRFVIDSTIGQTNNPQP